LPALLRDAGYTGWTSTTSAGWDRHDLLRRGAGGGGARSGRL